MAKAASEEDAVAEDWPELVPVDDELGALEDDGPVDDDDDEEDEGLLAAADAT